jgi:hypothetical protein
MLGGGEPGSLVGTGRGMPPRDPHRPARSSGRGDEAGVGRAFSAARSRRRVGQAADTVLGPAHPLTRASDAVARVARQWLICAALLAGAIIARLEGHPWATALIASSALILAAFTILLAALKQRLHDRVRDLIAEGREALPIATVQRQRRRLLTRKRRTGLARSFDTMVRYATNPPRIITRGARPLFDVRMIASVAPDLRAVIGLLQTGPARARGVALTERLITDGHSPLYGREAGLLREELRRIRRALGE